MPEPPQLTPLNVEEQRLYSELLPDSRAPDPISKGVPGHPAKALVISIQFVSVRRFDLICLPYICGVRSLTGRGHICLLLSLRGGGRTSKLDAVWNFRSTDTSHHPLD
ncbi:hypothetical protein AMECASPLE_016019 [Ameca splendens]|uniref:Uncharacterized protein n=1 Tax=Ameca splendens TaxID=208324 RepID=A0ABV0XQY0_9TELE